MTYMYPCTLKCKIHIQALPSNNFFFNTNPLIFLRFKLLLRLFFNAKDLKLGSCILIQYSLLVLNVRVWTVHRSIDKVWKGLTMCLLYKTKESSRHILSPGCYCLIHWPGLMALLPWSWKICHFQYIPQLEKEVLITGEIMPLSFTEHIQRFLSKWLLKSTTKMSK